MDRRLRITVSGWVQGVFFRHNTKRKADELGVMGTVRNLRDGSVEIVAEGDEDAIKRLVEWSKVGPPSARVKGIDITWEEVTREFKDFRIIY
jgi:acylphosphatase